MILICLCSRVQAVVFRLHRICLQPRFLCYSIYCRRKNWSDWRANVDPTQPTRGTDLCSRFPKNNVNSGYQIHSSKWRQQPKIEPVSCVGSHWYPPWSLSTHHKAPVFENSWTYHTRTSSHWGGGKIQIMRHMWNFTVQRMIYLLPSSDTGKKVCISEARIDCNKLEFTW